MTTGKLLVSGALLAVSLSVSAGSPYSDPAQRQAMLKEKYALTDVQAEQVQQILEGARAERKVIRDNATGDWEAAKPELEALRSRTHEQLSSVLNEDQMSKFDSIREKRFARYRNRDWTHSRSNRESE
jgi:phage shock protein A